MEKKEERVIIKEKIMNKGGDAVYGLGVLGALVYFTQHAQTLNDFLFGLVKSILWPAFLIYRVLQHWSI